MGLLKKEKLYTYQDYLAWPDDERVELIGGRVYDMAPAPSLKHQWIAGELHAQLKAKIRGGICFVFIAPLDVVLSEMDVVQPDVFIVCGRNKINPKGVNGAPDVVFEILSPHTAKKDRNEKMVLYARHGVGRYVIIDPESKHLEVYTLGGDGNYGKGTRVENGQPLELDLCGGVCVDTGPLFDYRSAGYDFE